MMTQFTQTNVTLTSLLVTTGNCNVELYVTAKWLTAWEIHVTMPNF